jgi:methyl-accepting chemotaxis protein
MKLHRMGIAAKVWLSVGIFLAGYLLSVALGQWQGFQAEKRLDLSSQTLFPAAMAAQEADAGFQRMTKAFSDAVMVEDSAALDKARQEGESIAASLSSAAALPGMPPGRAQELRSLSEQIQKLSSEARSAYGSMIGSGGNLTESMQSRSRQVASNTTTAREKLAQMRNALAAELNSGLSEARNQSARQRWVGLSVFCLTLLIAGLAVHWTISRSIIGPVERIVGGINQASDEATAAAHQMDAASDAVSRGASEQAACIEETSTALSEILNGTKDNVQRAHSADRLMTNARDTVKAATGTVDQLTTAMTEISDASRQVALVLKSIDEIAFQTNILALNAAVEAARAGEYGAGFAVVANEVRSLAQRAATAAQSSAELIEKANAKVSGGVEFVGATRSAFASLSKVVGDSSKVVSDIAASTEQQSASIGHISTAMSRIEKVTHTNSMHAGQTASAATQMKDQVQSTRENIYALSELIGV